MEEIEELKQKLNEAVVTTKQLEEKIKELESKRNIRWRAKKGDYYCYIDDAGDIDTHIDFRDEIDNYLYEIGNYFETEDEAEKTLEKQKIYIKLKDLALKLNKGEKIDWNSNKQPKYHIYYENDVKVISQETNYTYQHLGIYCLNRNFKEEAIKEIGEENLKKLFE